MVPFVYRTTLELSELFRTTPSFTHVWKGRLHGWVPDFYKAVGVKTPEFKNYELWHNTFVHIVHVSMPDKGLSSRLLI